MTRSAIVRALAATLLASVALCPEADAKVQDGNFVGTIQCDALPALRALRTRVTMSVAEGRARYEREIQQPGGGPTGTFERGEGPGHAERRDHRRHQGGRSGVQLRGGVRWPNRRGHRSPHRHPALEAPARERRDRALLFARADAGRAVAGAEERPPFHPPARVAVALAPGLAVTSTGRIVDSAIAGAAGVS